MYVRGNSIGTDGPDGPDRTDRTPFKSLLLHDKPIGASPGHDYVLTRMVLLII